MPPVKSRGSAQIVAKRERFLEHDQVEPPVVNARERGDSGTIAELRGVGDGDEERAMGRGDCGDAFTAAAIDSIRRRAIRQQLAR